MRGGSSSSPMALCTLWCVALVGLFTFLPLLLPALGPEGHPGLLLVFADFFLQRKNEKQQRKRGWGIRGELETVDQTKHTVLSLWLTGFFITFHDERVKNKTNHWKSLFVFLPLTFCSGVKFLILPMTPFSLFHFLPATRPALLRPGFFSSSSSSH